MLDARRLLESLIALAGIWLLFRQLPDYVATMYVAFVDSETVQADRFVAVQSIHFGASVFFGFLLIIVRKFVARWLTSDEVQASVQAEPMMAAGIAVVSLYFVLSGVVALGAHYVTTQMSNASNPYTLWQGVFSVVSGLLLFLLSIGLGRLWLLLRERTRLGA